MSGVGGIGGRISEGFERIEDRFENLVGESKEAFETMKTFFGEAKIAIKDLAEPGGLDRTIESFKMPKPAFPVAAPPRAGDPAPLLPKGVAGPAVLKFMRHAGCPFAEEDLANTVRAARENPGTSFAVIVHGDPAVAQEWFNKAGAPSNVRLVADEQAELYSKWGNGPTSRSYFSGPEGTLDTLKQMAKGHSLETLSGNRHWPGATAAVDANGRVAGFWPEKKMGEWVDAKTAIAATRPR